MARFSILVILSILSSLSQADTPTTPVEYSQDWEAGEVEVLNGWLAYINAFEADCTTYKGYGYSYEIRSGGTQVAVIARGPDSRVLNVYSNYDDSNLPTLETDLCLETNVYRQVIVAAENVGDYTFSFVAEPPADAGSNTNGFVKVLDQELNFSEIGVETVATTLGGEITVSFTIDESMVGKTLQFGFNTIAAGYTDSGMYYDNLVFGAAPSDGTDNGGSAEAASTTFNLLVEKIDAGRRGISIDKSAPTSEN